MADLTCSRCGYGSSDGSGYEVHDRHGRTLATLADALNAVAVMRALPDARAVVRLSDGEVIAVSARGLPPVTMPIGSDHATTTTAGGKNG